MVKGGILARTVLAQTTGVMFEMRDRMCLYKVGEKEVFSFFFLFAFESEGKKRDSNSDSHVFYVQMGKVEWNGLSVFSCVHRVRATVSPFIHSFAHHSSNVQLKKHNISLITPWLPARGLSSSSSSGTRTQGLMLPRFASNTTNSSSTSHLSSAHPPLVRTATAIMSGLG